MQKTLRKGLVVGIMLLFMGTSVVPKIKSDNGVKNSLFQKNKSTIDWWPMVRHDLGHSGKSSSDAPTTYNLKWNISYSSDSIDIDPLVYEDKIYFAYTNGFCNFYCVDSGDGSIIWSKENLTENGGLSGSVYGDGRIYVEGINNLLRATIWCFDSTTGTEIWSFSWLGAFASIPCTSMFYDGQLYFIWADMPYEGSPTIHIRCVKDYGNYALTTWDNTIDSMNLSGDKLVLPIPAIYNGQIYAITDYKVYRFNTTTGMKDWEIEREKRSDLSLAVVNNYIYFGEQGYVTCLNASNGNQVWSQQLDVNLLVVLPPAIAEGKVYVGFIKNDYSNYIYCLDDNNNGNILWFKHLFNTTSQDYLLSPPTVADGKVYEGGGVKQSWGKIYCFDGNDSTELWNHSMDSFRASPVIANGALYIGSTSGTLYKFENQNQNHAPSVPDINGPRKGKRGIVYNYTFCSTDSEGDDVSYYIDWGDNTTSGWLGPYTSGATITQSHTWTTKGSYTIKAKAKDIYGYESDWATLQVTMPLAYEPPYLQFFAWLFERFLHAFPILRHLLGY